MIKNKVKNLEFWTWEKLENLNFNDLKNNKKRDIKKLKKSITERGFFSPFYVWNNFCFDGTGRQIAIKELIKEGQEIPELPVLQIEANNLAEAKIYALQMSSQHGEITQESLYEFTVDIPEVETLINEVNFYEFDMEFGEVEAEEEIQAQEDNYDTTPPEEPITILGDIYEIGEHRLMCGDSTDSDQVAKLMDGEKADMAHNDPPYGMKKEKEGVLNDNLNFNDLLNFNREWIALQFMHLKKNGSWYCWGIDEPLMDIYSEILKPYIKEQKATFRNLITWDKGNGQGQNSDNTRSYAIADEKCLFVMCGVQDFDEHGKAQNYLMSYLQYMTKQKGRMKLNDNEINKILGYSSIANHWFLNKSQEQNQPRLISYNDYKKLQAYCQKHNIDAFKKEYEELKKEYYGTRAYFNNTHDNFNNVWKFDRHLRQGDEGGHATPKPIPLCERAIKSSCPDGGLVLDMFLGSGSTMVASHQLKRKCYGMELDPKYCDVIVKRMHKLDPDLQIKRNGKVVNNFN